MHTGAAQRSAPEQVLELGQTLGLQADVTQPLKGCGWRWRMLQPHQAWHGGGISKCDAQGDVRTAAGQAEKRHMNIMPFAARLQNLPHAQRHGQLANMTGHLNLLPPGRAPSPSLGAAPQLQDGRRLEAQGAVAAGLANVEGSGVIPYRAGAVPWARATCPAPMRRVR